MGLILFIGSCHESKNENLMNNPLLQEFNTPFEVPPFTKIALSDYVPAIREGIRVHNLEIENIIGNRKDPDFENTIVAFE